MKSLSKFSSVCRKTKLDTMAKFPIFVSLIVSQIIFYPEVIKVRITFWVCHFLKPADITNDNKKITIFTVTICFYLSSRLLTTEQLLSQETRNMKKKYPNEKKNALSKATINSNQSIFRISNFNFKNTSKSAFRIPSFRIN